MVTKKDLFEPISEKIVAAVREEYRPGQRVELVRNDDFIAPVPGTKGTVSFVDRNGTVFVEWDNGTRLGCLYGEDEIRLAD